MAPSLTEILAEHLASFSLDDLPPASLEKTRTLVLDFLAAAWNGLGHPLSATYLELTRELGGQGTSPVVGGTSSSPSWAAFANGAVSHITEVDDMSRLSTMHTGICVLPAVFALAGPETSGRRLMEAVVCGYEAGLRMGETLGRGHYSLFHTTGTAGTFGAAAAAAKVLGLDAGPTADALGHAGTQAMALWQFLEDEAIAAKPLHSAKAAQNGVTAACLAAKGVQGARRVLEGKKGYFAATAANPNIAALTRGLGTRFTVDEASIKSYPTCGQTHSMLDALRDILRKHAIGAADILEIEARVYEQAITIAGRETPRTLEEAKFSNQVCMALMAVMGDLTFANMTWDNVTLPEVTDFARRVRLVLDPEMDALFPKTRPCRIIVRTRDGRELTRENHFRTGDPERPMTPEQVRDKFRDLTAGILGPQAQDRIIEWCAALPDSRMTADLFRP